MARWTTIYGLRVKVGGTLYRWLIRNRLRLQGKLPKDKRRAEVVVWARWAAAQPGAATSYLFGGVPGIGTGTHTDCSGLMVALFAKVGVHLERTSQLQFARALGHPRLPRPGDMVFYNYEGPHSHVGLFVGDGRMIADQHTGSGIVNVTVDRAHEDGTGSYLP